MANIVITLPRNGEEKTYTLEFTRRTIIKMEEEGIISSLSKGGKQETLDKLVYYACLRNHPDITIKEAEDIVDNIPLNKYGDFVKDLADLLERSINALEETGKEGNAHWEAH